MMLVTLTNGTTEPYDDEPFAQGGQGTLHLSRDRQWVVKLYHQGDQRRIPALHKIINDLNVTEVRSVGGEPVRVAGWSRPIAAPGRANAQRQPAG